MAVVKVIEIVAQSQKGWEDAAHVALAEARKTLHNIKGIDISNLTAEVENGEIVNYRVDAKIAFVVDNT